jgi:hypothetical protein
MITKPLLMVRWVDSTTPRLGWIRLVEWEGAGSLDCVSVGYLIADNEKSITVAPHLAYPEDEENCQGSGIIVIPRPAIISISELTCCSDAAAYVAPDRSSDHQEFVPIRS